MKNLLVFLLVCFSFFNLNSQTYYPMGIDSSSFYISCIATDITPPYTYWVEQISYLGDTNVNGRTYTKCYNNYNQLDTSFAIDSIDFWYTYEFAIRDSAKQVFYLPKNDSVERLLFDFSLSIGDTMNHYKDIYSTTSGISVLTSIDSFLVRYPISHYRKKYKYSGQLASWHHGVIEGLDMSFLGYPMNPTRTVSCDLTCVQIKNEFVYKICDTCDCFQILDKHRRLDIYEISSINTLKTYPNPFQNNLLVEFSKGSGDIRIIDITGRTVFYKSYNNEESININTSKIPSGIYIVSITQNGKISRAKVVKE